MSIFSDIFGSSSDLEIRLEEQYIQMLQTGMDFPPAIAKKSVKGLIKRAKKDSKKNGTWNLPQNCGDEMLAKEASDDFIRANLKKARKEGVRDEDIRWYWNMHDLERMMMMKIDEVYCMSMFNEGKDKGLNSADAANKVRKQFATYGDPEETSMLSGKDRYLPHELKNRIDIYITKRLQQDPETFAKDVEEASSFNALVRKEIKNGNI